ncbi:MAG: thioredoxin domain-containing protein [Deltaproteobacteria bacterium]|nr:thioredoxin domain-containing protein [Deltaproteobacteria bacterium]
MAAPLPGAPAFSLELTRQLQKRYETTKHTSHPRTQHFCRADTPKFFNRLLMQSSPYLRQHAHNPVNWFPWGDEALRVAKELDRPILLSIGYSTCHWCHVMERESFEDLAIARRINKRYVAIKVDREERPDLDAIYMRAVRLLRGSGGWPLTLWLTPEGKPFFGGSYFPPRAGARGVKVGLSEWLENMASRYQNERSTVLEMARKLGAGVAGSFSVTPLATRTGGSSRAAGLHTLFNTYRRRFDEAWGGLQGAPKFPSGLSVPFLLRYHRRMRRPEALKMARVTLQKMAAGGMHDQLGGGFHRYATDARWRVPHFEKMLYDNALLASAYLDAYLASGDRRFEEVARSTLDYLLRDLLLAEGGFASGTDADSGGDGKAHGQEGLFYTWTLKEVEAALAKEQASLFAARYGVTRKGELEGRNVLYQAASLRALASRFLRGEDELQGELARSRATLLAARAGRSKPLRDEKRLAGWNGLAVSALARASFALREARYLHAAAQTADFLLREMRDGRGRLQRSFLGGKTSGAAYLDDYAAVIAGLLDLYEASFSLRWLQEARALEAIVQREFSDPSAGGFFFRPRGEEVLLARRKPHMDNARPSGNALMLLNLLRLHELTTVASYRERAEALMMAFGQQIARGGGSHSEMLVGVDFALGQPKEIVIITPSDLSAAEPLLEEVRRRFLPNKALIVSRGTPRAVKALPILENKVALGGRATAYVCVGGSCKRPTTEPAVLRRQLGAPPSSP